MAPVVAWTQNAVGNGQREAGVGETAEAGAEPGHLFVGGVERGGTVRVGVRADGKVDAVLGKADRQALAEDFESGDKAGLEGNGDAEGLGGVVAVELELGGVLFEAEWGEEVVDRGDALDDVRGGTHEVDVVLEGDGREGGVGGGETLEDAP